MRFNIVFQVDGQWYLITHLNTLLQLTKEKTRSSKVESKGVRQAEVINLDGHVEECAQLPHLPQQAL